MRERPILFSAPMVRAILAGRKTQTRRVAKPRRKPSLLELGAWSDAYVTDPGNRKLLMRECPFGDVDDRLWVRETWRQSYFTTTDGEVVEGRFRYRATDPADGVAAGWRPSIHMPRSASRITLEVTGVRVERLQDISESDAISEGVRQLRDGSECWVGREGPGSLVTPWPTARDAFRDLWQSINGLGSWGSNPWVWVVEFKRVGQ